MANRFTFTPIAAAALLASTALHAQTTLAPVVVTGRVDPSLAVAGWGDVPLSVTPMQASVFTSEQLRDRGAQRLADLVRADASVGDAYNAEGYWDFVSVRGYTLDNRFNYRRDGLPINAETSLPLDNKERVEVLKGLSGLQAGTSAPGGLVNLVVKRPTETPLRSATVGWREAGSALAAMDLSQRFGAQNTMGLRLNAAYEHLNPNLRSAKGERHLLAMAGDWRASATTLIEAEFETSHRSQPSQPGFSLLGDRLPSPVDPRINLNNQPWSQPVVMDGNTGSVGLTQKFSGWNLTARAATQRLKTDDHLAYPYGCSAEGPDGRYDRYCSDGTYDLYDFRSEGERRRTDALELAASGSAVLAGQQHQWSVGVLRSKVENRFGPQTYDISFAEPGSPTPGVGNVDGTLITYPNPSNNATNTNRDERSTELFLRDSLKLTDNLSAWAGLRHTRQTRASAQTDGSEATSYEQSFNTPFAALSYTLAPAQLLYASWSRGVESDVVPRRSEFTNAGQALPAAKSRQWELGLKVGTTKAAWGFAFFDIKRPGWTNTGLCDGSNDSCTRIADGRAHHRGVEANAAWRADEWSYLGSVMVLTARREDSVVDPSINGKQPTNVAARTAKLQVKYQPAALHGLSLQADALGSSQRKVLEDNSVSIPGYGVADISARYEQKLASTTLTWRAGIDNLFDRRAWRESPFQYGHAYLYPLAGRTARLSLEMSL